MPKGQRTHGAQKASRSRKHKDHNPKRLANIDDSASMEIEKEEVAQPKKQKKQKVEEEEGDDDDDEMDEENGSVTSTGVKTISDYAPNMLSKEEKKTIRKDRQKRNKKNNLYKIRNGNCTGKNGPRAINRVSFK